MCCLLRDTQNAASPSPTRSGTNPKDQSPILVCLPAPATPQALSWFVLLAPATHADSLDAYCNKNFGYQCMDTILDPECPGLFRQNNVWMSSTNKATLCDSRCLKALCRLQEQAKTAVTGALRFFASKLGVLFSWALQPNDWFFF